MPISEERWEGYLALLHAIVEGTLPREMELEEAKPPPGVRLLSEHVCELVWFIDNHPKLTKKECLNEWNKGHPEHQYKTVSGMMFIYRRAKKKLLPME